MKPKRSRLEIMRLLEDLHSNTSIVPSDNEVEKALFELFNIRDRVEYYCPKCGALIQKWLDKKGTSYECSQCDFTIKSWHKRFMKVIPSLQQKIVPPTITDRQILELICVLNALGSDREYLTTFRYERLREVVLQDCIDSKLRLNPDYSDVITACVQGILEERLNVR